MAKNLKLNIKNAQLAEALKLKPLKKPVGKQKASEEVAAEPKAPPPPPPPKSEPSPVEKVVGVTFDEPSVKEAHPIAEPPQTPPVKSPVKSMAPPQRTETPQARPTTYPPRAQPQDTERRSYPPRGATGGEYRKPYPPRSGEYGKPPYPPRSGEYGKPPYPPRSAGPGGEYRKPYPPRPSGPGGEYRKPYPPRPGGAGGEYRRPYPPRQEGHPEFKRAFGAKPEGGRPPYTPRPFPPRGEGKPDSRRAPSRDALPPKRTLKPGARTEERGTEGKKTSQKDFRDFKVQKKPVQTDRAFDSRDKQGLRADLDEQTWRKRRPSHKARPLVQEETIRPKNLKVRLPITIKDLAAEMKLKSSQLISYLFMKGVVLTLNDYLDDPTTVQLLGHDFDCEITIDTSEEERVRITDKTIKQEVQESLADALIIRPPVVAFMGHVDHGKTSLIDAIRKTNLAAGEAGAITQHIGAFKCHTDQGDITVLDTPGHEAFSAMRTRGADVTDIVVLVVAGDEGVRPQTLEAIQQAQTANVPIVVAITKSDKPNFNAENIYRQLADQQLLPEVWGGQTITVNCSAVTGDGIQPLVEMLALQAEILELRANPNARARGTVIESEMHKGLGPVATVLVQNGTLYLGGALVFSQNYARVKTMHNEFGQELTEAGPSTPVKITGLSGLPEAGSEFIVVGSEKEARELAERRIEGKRFQMMQQPKRATTESFLQGHTGTVLPKKILNLILRADVQGSVEALKTSLLKIPSVKVELNIISAAVGEISESDVELAQTSKATILGFHTQVESHAASLIKELKVAVKLHDIIYHAVDDVKIMMESLLDKIAQENDIGTALVKATFKASQLGIIAGCMVTDGLIKRSCHIRIMRNNEVVWRGAIASLKRVQEDVRDVSKGMECGILLQNYNDVKVGDELQAYEITYLKQEL